MLARHEYAVLILASWTGAAEAKQVSEVIHAEARDASSGTLIQRRINELALLLLKCDNAVLDSALDQDTMDLDRQLLADAVGTVNCLHLDVWVPEGIEDDDLGGASQVESSISSLERDEHDLHVALLHELPNSIVALHS